MPDEDRQDRPDSDRDALLRALLLGERDAEDVAVRRAFDEDPELRARWEVLSATTRALDAAGRLEEELLCEIENAPPAPGEQDVERIVAELRRPAPSAPPGWRRRLTWALAAAAVVLVSAWLVTRQPGVEPGGGEGIYMGPEEEAPVLVGLDEPLAAESFSEIRWRWAPEEDWDGYCRVELSDDSGWSVSEDVLDPVEERAPSEEDLWEWRPRPEQLDEIRAREGFWVQVFAEPSDGSETVSSSAQRVTLLR